LIRTETELSLDGDISNRRVRTPNGASKGGCLKLRFHAVQEKNFVKPEKGRGLVVALASSNSSVPKEKTIVGLSSITWGIGQKRPDKKSRGLMTLAGGEQAEKKIEVWLRKTLPKENSRKGGKRM